MSLKFQTVILSFLVFFLFNFTKAQFDTGLCYPYDEAEPLVKNGTHKFFNFNKGTLISHLGDAKNYPPASYPALESAFKKGFSIVSTRVCGASDIGGVLVESHFTDLEIEGMERSNVYDQTSDFLSKQIYKKVKRIGGKDYTYKDTALSTYSDLRKLINKYRKGVILLEVLPLDNYAMDLSMRIVLRKNVENLYYFLEKLNAWDSIGIFYTSNFPILLFRDKIGCDGLYGKRYLPDFLTSEPSVQQQIALNDGDYATYMRCVEMSLLRDQNFSNYYEFTYTNGDLNRLACVGFISFDYKMFDMQKDKSIVLYPGILSNVAKNSTYNGDHKMKIISFVDIQEFFLMQNKIEEKLKTQVNSENVDYLMATFDRPKL